MSFSPRKPGPGSRLSVATGALSVPAMAFVGTPTAVMLGAGFVASNVLLPSEVERSAGFLGLGTVLTAGRRGPTPFADVWHGQQGQRSSSTTTAALLRFPRIPGPILRWHRAAVVPAKRGRED